MKTKITALEVAQIAVSLDCHLGEDDVSPDKAIHRAIIVLRAAEHAIAKEEIWKQQLAELKAAVLTMPSKEWNRRLSEFDGDRRALRRLLEGYIPSAKVHQALFKNKTHTAKNREVFFLRLATFAKNHGMSPPPLYNDLQPMNDEDRAAKEFLTSPGVDPSNPFNPLEGGGLQVYVVRWAFEVREKQIAFSKSRDIPLSQKQERHPDGDSIQFKPKYRA